MSRRVLVSQTRMPEFDRDRGSARVDELIRFLLDDGWSVTFLADDDTADARYAHRLRQLGVATFAEYANAPDIIRNNEFDLAVVAFWQQSARLLPVLRDLSPATKVIIDSIDVHFLRDARRQFGIDGRLDAQYGAQLAEELNTYRSADAVLAVSAKEAELLGDFLGDGHTHCLPLGETASRSTVPFEDRTGILFVGNFRHLPNGEAVEYLCHSVLPRLDPSVLAQHPLTVIGNRLDDKIREHARGLTNVQMVGWAPSVGPYVHRARVSVVPLLHGAGVKGKVVHSMMSGTPVVTTPIGAEGLDLVDGEHALIGDEPQDLAAAITRLLVDRDSWHRIAENAWNHARAAHDSETVRARFREIIATVLAAPHRAVEDERFRHSRRRIRSYRASTAAVPGIVRAVCDPGAIVLVASRGDDELVRFEGFRGWHFPQTSDGRWAGYHPADSEAAVRELEALRARGARYLVFPSSAFWWLHYYDGLTAHLDARHLRIHADEHAVVYQLRAERSAPAAPATSDGRVLVLGTHAAGRTGPPPSLVAELDRSRRFSVTQRWTAAVEPIDPPSGAEAEWVVTIDDTAVPRSGFIDELLAAAEAVGAERIQPGHAAGPDAGAPLAERLLGCFGRLVSTWLPLPVRAVRSGAAPEGPVLVVDRVPIGLTGKMASRADADLLDVLVEGPDGPCPNVRRSRPEGSPRVSVLVATYDRPELLASCLEGFCRQTLPAAEFEVVVVDDGSPGTATLETIERTADRLPLVWARIEHAGRSAAKNLAAQLARGDIVLFFDDDDRPEPELLVEHLRAHHAHPSDEIAILGHTDWAPELAVTPLMHYLTEIDKVLFAYGNLTDGQQLDWRGFWEGRVSCKRSLLRAHGLHDQRLAYSIDVELAWRLAAHGLKVVYHAAARSLMTRAIDFEQFCARLEAKGRAQAQMASLHDDPEVRGYTKIDDALERWPAVRATLPELVARVRALEARGEDDAGRDALYGSYREAFAAYYAKGVAEVLGPPTALALAPAATNGSLPVRVSSTEGASPSAQSALSVIIPVWSRTEELARMAQGTIDRIWEVARLDTEVTVVDNGSPFGSPSGADVYRYESNRGVAVAWNAGIELTRAPVIAVLNSDCLVEAGWDEALYEAARSGRRIAFPYTDHADGRGFRCPDQGGTAGWCFMLTRALSREIGAFDEQFSPAYCEDTDYWHRAWQLGIELSPVPAAHVTHARRTTGRTDPHADWLLQSHRYKYGWKHGVDPLRAPPYYNREIVDYVAR